MSKDWGQSTRLDELSEDNILISRAIPLPYAALAVAVGLMSESTNAVIGLGLALLLFNLLTTRLTQRDATRGMPDSDPGLPLLESLRYPINIVFTVGLIVLSHPGPGWVLMIPMVAAMSIATQGRMLKLTVASCIGGGALTLALLGASAELLLLSTSATSAVALVVVHCARRHQRSRVHLDEIVTEVIQHEREHSRALLSAQRSSRLAAVGQLAAGVAHEINNPLTYVISNIEFILESHPELAKSLTSAQGRQLAESANDALEGAHRVRRIVSGIKLFSRLDREVTVTEVDVNDTLESSLDIAQNQLRHQATLEIDLADELPLVQADKGRLGQVFINLLINAAQALPAEPSDDREFKIIVKTRADEEDNVVISIEDNGVGIAPSKLSQIFEPFYTSKAVGEGTGLGLSIAHGIVSDLKGHIDVASEVGKGTIFSIVLPTGQDDAELEVQTQEYEQVDEHSPGRILIIDDDALVAKSLARSLKNQDTTVVDGGEAALALLREDSDFGVVFCDLMMPGLSGPKFFEKVEKEFPDLASKVIFITGGVFSDVIQAFLDKSGVNCLYKPFSRESVRDAMATLQAANREAPGPRATDGA